MDIDIEIPLALDKRVYDLDGRLHVSDCILSVASVDPYIGREIVDFQSLGLDPGRVYQMYRDPAALKAAAPTFENMPLMADHVGVTANDPQKALIVGVVSNVRWTAPRLIGDIAVWDAAAIVGIRDGSKRDLSCGYRYQPDMRAGTTPDGEHFDGRLAAPIACNHIALVTQGRVPGATVADAMPQFHTNIADRLAADRERVQRVCENSPLGRAVPGYFRLR